MGSKIIYNIILWLHCSDEKVNKYFEIDYFKLDSENYMSKESAFYKVMGLFLTILRNVGLWNVPKLKPKAQNKII